jgi:hypothetical protein
VTGRVQNLQLVLRMELAEFAHRAGQRADRFKLCRQKSSGSAEELRLLMSQELERLGRRELIRYFA